MVKVILVVGNGKKNGRVRKTHPVFKFGGVFVTHETAVKPSRFAGLFVIVFSCQ